MATRIGLTLGLFVCYTNPGMTKPTKTQKDPGGRPTLGPGRGRQGTMIRARVDLAEKSAITRFAREAGISEGELVRVALQRVGVLKPRPSPGRPVMERLDWEGIE
jgi:hypothetical protein